MFEFSCKRFSDGHDGPFRYNQREGDIIVRDDYLEKAQKVVTDPMILINMVSRRAKQLKSGYKPLVESLERLSAEDLALREIMEGKITYQLDETQKFS